MFNAITKIKNYIKSKNTYDFYYTYMYLQHIRYIIILCDEVNNQFCQHCLSERNEIS